MSTENERIKEIRKSAGLTLDKFGERVGLKKSSLSQVESGVNAVSGSLRKAVCREFGVNEEWLRTGEGEMFVPRTKNQVITDFMADLVMEDDSFKKRIIEALAQLDAKDWEELERIALKVLERKNGEQD